MKQQRIPLLRTLTFITASLAAATSMAQVAPGALPSGGRVAAGQAQILQGAGRLDIRQDSQKAILEWNNFNIGSQAQVVFSQPNSSAIALNRVVTSDPSGIFGRLNANGQVFLINPNGILFGAGSSINVGGLVASTLNIKDGEFFNGNYRFTRDGALGAVGNQGNLTAADQGYIALLAPTVRNEGTISARYGTVALAAGDAVTLGLQGAGPARLLNLRVEPATVNALVENRQAIRTEGGSVLASARAVDGLIGQAINNGGVVEAGTVFLDGKNIILEGGSGYVVFPPPATNAAAVSQTVINSVNQTISSATASTAQSMATAMNAPLPQMKTPLPGGAPIPGVSMLPQAKPVLTMALPGVAPMPVGQIGGVVPQQPLQPQPGINLNQPMVQGSISQPQPQPGSGLNQPPIQGNTPQPQPDVNQNQPLVQGNVPQQQPQPGANQNQPVVQGDAPQQQFQPNNPNQPVAQDGKNAPVQPVKVAQKNPPDKQQEGKNPPGEGTSQAKSEGKADKAPDKGEKSEKSEKTDVSRAAKAAASGRFAQLMAADALRHQMRTELYKDALNVLQQNPAAADVPTCGSGAGALCIPAPVEVPKAGEAAASTLAQNAASLAAGQAGLLPATPIRRKVAYLIGNNDYKGAIPALETPIGDVEAIAGQLNQKLGYEVNVVKNASKADIILTLKKAAESATQDESVLIMYAGHGYQIDSTKQGYWIPTDASNTTPEKWVSNSDITKFMSAIPAKQVILISDSCFSGSLAKEQKMVATGGNKGEILSRRSVLVMSSGGEEPVSDEGKDGHSIFAYTLINQLKRVSDFSTSSQVFENVKTEVSQEYPQEPQLGMVTSAGHTVGGDYLFEINQVIRGGLK